MGNDILEALMSILSLQGIVCMALGVCIGTVFGAIPGLNGGLAMCVLIPVTFTMDPMPAILLLLGVYCAGMYGGSLSSILLGTPGSVESSATCLDGRPLAVQGYANKALKMALLASVAGGVISAILLMGAAPTIAKYAVHLGAPEYFAAALLGIAIIAGVSGKSPFYGFIAAGIGVLCSCIGVDTTFGAQRYTFGNLNLLGGMPLLPLLLGVFAMSEVYKGLLKRHQDSQGVEVFPHQPDDRLTKKDVKTCGTTILKGSMIGSIIGAIPGAGCAIAAFISYAEAKRSSKTPLRFGTGCIEGVAAPESANNAVAASSFIPLLTLGIPGSVGAATLQGALNMQGVACGPLMMTQQGVMFWGIILGFLIIQFIMLGEGFLFIRIFKNIMNVPMDLVRASLVVFCLAGAYVYQKRPFDILAFIVIGTLFYVLFKFGATGAPFVLGFILGPTIEFNLCGSLVIGQGSPMVFLTRPVCLVLEIAAVAIFILLYRQNKMCNRMMQESLKDQVDELGEEV